MLFGKKIRELRDENGVLQRQLAALLEIDTPMFSKIERGDRRAKREQVIKLAEYFHQDENEMLTFGWLTKCLMRWMASENSVRKPWKLPKNKSKNCKSMEIDILVFIFLWLFGYEAFHMRDQAIKANVKLQVICNDFGHHPAVARTFHMLDSIYNEPIPPRP